jgi:hypothetical protein
MRIIVPAALFLLAIGLQIWMILVFRRMMDEVNHMLPDDSGIPEIGPSFLRGRVIKLHRRFFPNSTLRKRLYGLWGLQMLAFGFALACTLTFTS